VQNNYPQHTGFKLRFHVSLLHLSRRSAMNDKNPIRALYVAWAVGLVMLGLAVSGKHPYNFYILLRWILCTVFAFSAFATYRLKRTLWACAFLVQAVLFNPFASFHFPRDTWQTLDKLSLASLAVAAVLYWRSLKPR
jgi:hypothetical protein